ncbi:winged helix-turn-helix domain-containing protein [bacterium]|nr:winged helix-turn-helix domain-containing protein [bacterium]
MTLHEAIKVVLEGADRPMSTREIAAELNRRGLYAKKDGTEITDFQVHGRTKNYPKLFRREGTTVSLI